MKNEEIIEVIQEMLQTADSLTAKDVQEKIGDIALIQVQKPLRTLIEDDIIYLVQGSNPKQYRKLTQDSNSSSELEFKKGTRDLSTFTFMKVKNLPKGRLVHAVIKQYVIDYNSTIDELQLAFPETIIKPYGVFKPLNIALEMSQDRKRYFTNEIDHIKLKDGSIVCCTNQWTRERTAKFIDRVLEITNYKIS